MEIDVYVYGVQYTPQYVETFWYDKVRVCQIQQQNKKKTDNWWLSNRSLSSQAIIVFQLKKW